MAAFTLDGKDYDDYIDGIPGKYSKANDKYGCTRKRASCFRTARNGFFICCVPRSSKETA